ncbi:MAG TPA: RNA 2'-phosphotransferase [Nannocystaceae bacterium]|nr:RNA 2'-phosphotransferase [Nannocystaceae bacterium]
MSAPSKATIARSKELSWLLRHGARETGIAMDEAGWVAIVDVLARTGMTRDELDDAVRTNTKGRLQIDGERVRACQGHSLAGTPVTHEGLERSWRAHDGDAPLWHGTTRDAIDGIAKAGILPIARTHVHLAPSESSLVGKRSNVAFLLAIDPPRLRAEGFGIFLAPNGVVLVREVPPRCIVGVQATTARARAELDEVHRILGLP